ncbi:MAG: glycoside hydrolase family 97 N-terminal domain-containing protein, partial [Bacteroidetes bacterium]|nr:glycoside hydrolase family 97 N-terminal domain-containing protein [Bacteroidota bacterium]
MKKTLALSAGIFITCLAFAQSAAVLGAHMGKTLLQFRLDLKDVPVYEVSYNGRPVITPSLMGFRLGDEAMQTGFELTGSEIKSFDETWQPVWGEQKNIRNHYEQLTVHLRQKAAPNRLLDICFRVFEDGVGFRYLFPQQPNLGYFIITDELTGFSLAGDHKAFWIPGDYDTNEYPYTISPLSQIDNRALVAASTDIAVRDAPDAQSVQTPLMLKTADGLYINIHEAGLGSYPAMQLHVDRDSHKLIAALVPDALGNKAYLHAPCATPWRTIIISDKAADILASKLILNLNEPCAIKNTSWIKPMKFAGVWWEMQTGVGGWNYADHIEVPDSLGNTRPLKPNGRHSANTANVKRYIDFAARNGIKGLLVEGWNTG